MQNVTNYYRLSFRQVPLMQNIVSGSKNKGYDTFYLCDSDNYCHSGGTGFMLSGFKS
jgi:hypothetical protein